MHVPTPSSPAAGPDCADALPPELHSATTETTHWSAGCAAPAVVFVDECAEYPQVALGTKATWQDASVLDASPHMVLWELDAESPDYYLEGPDEKPSDGHLQGKCQPCRFQFYHHSDPGKNQPCNNGIDCEFCHEPHSFEYMRLIKKESKTRKMKRKNARHFAAMATSSQC